MTDHWFDTLNKALVQEQPRRTLLGAATVLVANLGEPLSAAAKKGNKGKKGNKDKKHKGRNPLAECQIPDGMPCSGRACRTAWAGCSRYDTANRNYCEFICEQCQVPGNGPFCILGGDVADCCAPGLVCCGDFCAQLGTQDHCTGCDQPCRGDGTKCCPSPVTPRCVNTKDHRFHCGDCGQFCLGEDRKCCDGSCEDIVFNNAHCGGCDPCPTDWECCHGSCIESDTSTCCRDRPEPPHSCPSSSLRLGWCCMEDGLPSCCRETE